MLSISHRFVNEQSQFSLRTDTSLGQESGQFLSDSSQQRTESEIRLCPQVDNFHSSACSNAELSPLSILIDSFNVLPPINTFESLTRNLKGDDLQRISQIPFSIDNLDEKLDALLAAIKNSDWTASIFRSKECDDLAIYAVKIGQLPVEEFTSLMLFLSVFKKNHDGSYLIDLNIVDIIPLFNPNGGVNPTAYHLIKSSLENSPYEEKLNDTFI